KTSIKTITYLSDTGCLEIQGASLVNSRPVTLSVWFTVTSSTTLL
ncbi:fimbrial protein, partial [Shigella sonnei]|nr:fimbrial protein [Shigella sonnei]EFY2339623.1 fimbrial protein [Shigella sonnei]